MSTSETESTTTASTMASPVPVQRRAAAELTSEHGRTSISDVVVAKIVAMATREVDGVYAMGTGSARMLGAVRQRVPGARASEAQGVAVEVGELGHRIQCPVAPCGHWTRGADVSVSSSPGR